jgi:hypothetical protein
MARVSTHSSTGASSDFEASVRVTATPSDMTCPTTAPWLRGGGEERGEEGGVCSDHLPDDGAVFVEDDLIPAERMAGRVSLGVRGAASASLAG